MANIFTLAGLEAELNSSAMSSGLSISALVRVRSVDPFIVIAFHFGDIKVSNLMNFGTNKNEQL